jgi:glycine cleavage system aminomethyltransferase T
MTVLIKQPSESRVYAVNFRNLLAAGDSVKTVTSVTASPTAELTIGTAVISSPRVKFRVEDGVAGTSYRINVIVTTAGGDTLEGDGDLEVSNL